MIQSKYASPTQESLEAKFVLIWEDRDPPCIALQLPKKPANPTAHISTN